MSTPLPAYARRLKAALDLRGWTMAELAAHVRRTHPEFSLSKSTLDQIAQGKREPREWELPALAELLLVPEWFLRSGFQSAHLVPSETHVDPAGNLLEVDATTHRLLSLLAERQSRVEGLLDDLIGALRAAGVAPPEAAREDRPHVPTPGGGPAGLR